MANTAFHIDTGFLSARFSARQRALVVALAIVIGLAVAYANYLTTLNLAPLGVLVIIAIEAVGGLIAGIMAGIVAAFAFALADQLRSYHHMGPGIIGNAFVLLLLYLLVALLVEFLRRQTAVLDESRLRLQNLELSQAKAELAQSFARYRAVGESMPFGVWHCDAEGRVVYMSDTFLQLVDMTLEETRNGGWLNRVLPEDAERVREAWRNRAGWGDVWEDEYRIVGADKKMYTILCRGQPVRDEKRQTIGWTGINLDITERARSRSQLAFLAEAGRVLSLSLDPSTTLERIASLAVPRLADWCAVDVVDDDGEIRPLAVLHADASKTEVARELRAYPESSDETRGLRHVLRTGDPELYEDIPDELLVQAAVDERQLQLLREIGMRSVMIIPLIARARILGAITFVTAESGRRYGKDDLAFAELLARRAALSYDNARMYTREQRVADTLQRASLPMSLPQLPGIRLRATYLPGASESEIGGDWYDAFALPDGRLAVSIGDVAGKGLRAAVAMGSARQAMRATALEGSSPAEVLLRVNRLLVHEAIGMVTAVFGILDPVTLKFQFATAGHPPPLHAYPKEPVQRLIGRGLPLGLFADNTYVEETTQLRAGSLLVFYTDGLIEFDRDVINGETILSEAVEAQSLAETPDPAISIVRRVILGVPKDDVAVLTVSVSAQPIEEIDITAQATPASARVLRQSLRRMALSIGLTEDLTFDVLVASGEAISNAIEHAYGIKDGTLRLRAFRQADELLIEVQDYGTWRAPQNSGRGRGLKLMRALMQRVDIQCNEQGTLVRMSVPLSDYAYDRSSNVSATRV